MEAQSLNVLAGNIASQLPGELGTSATEQNAPTTDFAVLLAIGLQLAEPSPLEIKPQRSDIPSEELITDERIDSQTPEFLSLSTLLPSVLPASSPLPPTVNPQATGSDVGRAGDGVVERPAPQRVATDRAQIIATESLADHPANIAAAAESPAALSAQAAADPKWPAAEIHAPAQLTNPLETPAPAEIAHGGSHPLHALESRAPIQQPSALLEVAAPVSEPGFADALSRQVVWMVDKDAQVAELRINPPELGPIEVRLSLSGDTAAAQFVSAHAEVREAIENAMARLRETLALSGITLGDTSVGAESFSGTDNTRDSDQGSDAQYRDRVATSESAGATAGTRRLAGGVGLVDVFA
jgi:flagellar hook-length control protein FliK